MQSTSFLPVVEYVRASSLGTAASDHDVAADHSRTGSTDALTQCAEAARVRMDACCAHCCGIDPLTVEGLQSQTGHDDATTQDFAKSRVHFGDGYASDLWFYLRNAHSLLALFAQHPNNPYKLRARIGALLVTLAYALMLTSILTIYFSTATCAGTTCSSCLAVNAHNADYEQHCPHPNRTWIGIDCESQLVVVNFIRSFWAGGGCQWFARRPQLWANVTDGYGIRISDPGNGCVDPVYSILIKHTGEWDLFQQWIDSAKANSFRTLMCNETWPPPYGDASRTRQPYLPTVCSPTDASLLQFLNHTAVAPLAVKLDRNDGICASLPAFANSSVMSATSAFNMETDVVAYWYRFGASQVVSFLVLLFSRALGMAAVCSCARRGDRRRITVCCCQSAATLCYINMFLLGLSFLAAGAALVSLTPGDASDQMAVVIHFSLLKLLAWVYEVGTCIAFFSVAYALQRNCRYNACCVCCCGCCGFGLIGARTEATRHVSFASAFDVPMTSALLEHDKADDER